MQGATELARKDLKNPESRKNLKKDFARGLDNRLMRSNDVNETSSRSHLLFICRLSKMDRKTQKVSSGKITFVDLAGSERLANLEFDEDLYEEAIFINESLQFLGRTLYCLSDG